MALATIQADIEDDRDSITLQTGSQTQTKAIMVVIDDTQLPGTSTEDTRAIDVTLRRIADAIRANAPIATA